MRINGLYFSYNDFTIFDDFSFESDARVILIKGPNGCGKTTLLRLISGNLIPASCMIAPSPSNISLILQEDALFPWLTGEANVCRLLQIRPCDKHLLTNHHMYPVVQPFIKKLAYQMSYGQRRLIELMRAIMYKPSVLCLDEPFNFLDTCSKRIASEFLFSAELQGTRLIISTHEKDGLDHIRADTMPEEFTFSGDFPVRRLERLL